MDGLTETLVDGGRLEPRLAGVLLDGRVRTELGSTVDLRDGGARHNVIIFT